MTHPSAAAVVEHADAVALGKWIVWIHFLGDGKRVATPIETDLDFDTLASVYRFLCVRSSSSSESCAANGGKGLACAAADLIAEHASCHAAEDQAGSAAAFDFYIADRSDAALLDGLGDAGLVARVGVTGEALLGAGNEKERKGYECDDGFHDAR